MLEEVGYYEVALGTDRRFSQTVNDIVPFTNVGQNNTVTFSHLKLTAKKAMYFFTVRAYSTTGSMTEVTSNGFYPGYDSTVTASAFIRPGDYWSLRDRLVLQWDPFTSDEVGMDLYHIAVSDKRPPQLKDQAYTPRQLVSDSLHENIFLKHFWCACGELMRSCGVGRRRRQLV
jgi:hypothetical protein